MDDRTIGIAYVVGGATAFGAVGIFGTVASDAGLSIPTVLVFRFAIATAVLWAVLAFRGHARVLPGRTLGWAAVLGAVGYGGMSGFYFLGLEFMTAGLVAILLYTFPAIVVAVSIVTNPERVNATLVAALGLSLAGVALIVGADPAGADPRGVVVMLCSAVCYAGYMLGSERVLGTVDPEVLTAHVLPASGVVFLALGLTTGTLEVPPADAIGTWAVLVGLSVGSTVVPILLLYAGLPRIGASRASIVSTIEPGVAVVLGALLLAEPVTATTVAGGGLVVLGVILIHRRT